MTIKTNEKIKTETKLSKEELEFKLEIATQTLDRNINFIANCDNKTSIVLATFLGAFAIILTNEGANKILNIVKTCLETKTFCNILYLLCLISAFFVMMLGVFILGNILIAKTSEEAIGRKAENSRIFFAGIRKSGNYNTYNQRFRTMNKEDLLNDLIEQIYINADIASNKYATYNRGVRCIIIGFTLFVFFIFIGIYIY